MLSSRTQELLADQYAGKFLVYTDGSVLKDGRTGVAFFFQATGETFSVRLSPTTILTGELVAIREAMGNILAFPRKPPQVTMLYDSRSSLIVLQNAYCTSRPDVLNNILHLSIEGVHLGVRLQCQWVPSHVGLHGNERASSSAK
ncbi:uncharacterized protein LOC143035663 [Oratosquilla oratoria]|uniref:uncharacterized protein LOC143035663 n=1 Tax=Oratosquilla oratoria TaxID=337810 RepID=UPI003F76D18E